MTGCKVLSKDDFIGQICEICDYSSNLDLEEGAKYIEQAISKMIKTARSTSESKKQLKMLSDALDEFYNSPEDDYGQYLTLMFDPGTKSLLFNPNYDKKLADNKAVSSNFEEAAKASRNLRQRNFLETRFKNAPNAKLYFKRSIKNDMVETFLVERSGDNSKYFTSQEDMNLSVKAYKQRLLNRIFDYFNSSAILQAKIKGLPTTFYDKNGVYTEVISKIKPAIDSVLNPEVFAKNAGIRSLEQYYADYRDTVGAKQQTAQKFLDAYNAWVTLQDFDTIVQDTIGTVVKVGSGHFNKHTGDLTKYEIKGRATNMWNNWTTSDDIADMSEVVSDVTQMLVETSRMYKWKNEEAYPDRYLSFNDFNYAIGLVKRMAFDPHSDTLQLGPRFPGLANTSSHTKRILLEIISWNRANGNFQRNPDGSLSKTPKVPTWKQLIARVNENPQRYLHAVFDILCNTDILDNYSLNDYEKNLLWSLNKELFGLGTKDNRSLYKIHDRTTGDNVYQIITQVAASTFPEDYLQYYEKYDGAISTRLLQGYELDRIKNTLLASIEQTGRTLTTDWYLRNGIQVINRGSDDKDITYLGEIKMSIDISASVVRGKNIPAFKFEFSSTIDGVTVDDYTSDQYLAIWNNQQVQTYFKDILGLNFTGDPDFKNAYMEIMKTPDKAIQDLSNLLGRVLFNAAVNNFYVPQHGDATKTAEALRKFIKNQYKTHASNYESGISYSSGTVPLLPVNVKTALVGNLAMADAINRNLLAQAQSKTGEGTSLANYTLSRMRNFYHNQVEMQCKKLNSAVKDLSFVVNTNGLFEGILSRRELKTNKTNQQSTKFSDQQSFQLSFINDFVSAFIPNPDENAYIKNGKVSFLPTVNSDKTQIDGLLVNLNAISRIPKEGGGFKTYIELTDAEIEKEMELEFKPMYDRIIANINTELGKVYKVLSDLNAQLINEGKQPLELPKVNNSTSVITKNQSLLEAINKAFSGRPEYGSPKDRVINGLHAVLTNYNKTHSRSPIMLSPHVHYVINKDTGLLESNKTLEALWGRFNQDMHQGVRNRLTALYAKEPDYQAYMQRNGLTDPTSAQSFFKYKEHLTIENLLKMKFQVYLKGSNDVVRHDQDEIKFLKGKVEFNEAQQADPAYAHLVALNEQMKDWVDNESGLMIIAKGIVNGQLTNITTLDQLHNATNLQIHPMLSKLNRLDYLCSQQYTISTVGSHYVHKGGAQAGSILVEEAQRWLASNKRNVAATSTVHLFQNKQLDGSPSVYNVSIIEDVKFDLYNIMGDLYLNGHAPLDGGMFVNAWMPDIENNSLAGEKAGLDKKHFGTFYSELYGAGGIVKTAGFAATNSRMRRQKAWQNLQRAMSSRKWIKELPDANGADIIEDNIDITKDFLNKPINYRDAIKGQRIFYKKVCHEDSTLLSAYEQLGIQKLKHGIIFKNPITGQEILAGANSYVIKEVEVNANGDPISDVIYRVEHNIDNNWDLFTKIFGGYNSLELGNDNKLTWSENSNKLMVHAINNVGYRKSFANIHAENKGQFGEKFTKDLAVQEKKITTGLDQDDVWQPLKYSDIHLTPNIGAIKSLQFNVNPDGDAVLEGKSELNHFVMRLAQLGIQLDKEHHADAAEVSMPTQIIQACANRSYTSDYARELYTALATLTRQATQPFLDGIKGIITSSDPSKLVEEVTNLIVDNLLHQSGDDSSANVILKDLFDKAEQGKTLKFAEDIKGKVAWSDPTINAKIFSSLSTTLTNLAVKMKFAGTLSVICPTDRVEKIYGDRLLDSFTKVFDENESTRTKLTTTNMLEYQNSVREGNEVDADGRNMLIFDLTRDAIDVPRKEGETDGDYQTRVVEAIKRNKLAKLSEIKTQHNYIIEYNDGHNEIKEKITINTPQDYYRLKNLVLNGKKPDLNVNGANIPVRKVYEDVEEGRALGAYNVRFTDATTGYRFQIYDLDSIHTLFDLNHLMSKPPKGYKKFITLSPDEQQKILNKIFKSPAFPTMATYYRLKEQYANIPMLDSNFIVNLNAIYPNQVEQIINAMYELSKPRVYKSMQKDLFKLSANYKGTDRKVFANGMEVDPMEMQYDAYELIMPKIYKTQFGLQEFDDLQEILRDKDFFVKRGLSRFACKLDHSLYDYELKNFNGEHYYVLDKSKGIPDRLAKEIQAIFQEKKRGKLYRTDSDGNIMYEMSSEEDAVCQVGDIQVIITDNPLFYVQNLNYNTLKTSPKRVTDESYQKLIETLKESKRQNSKNFLKAITDPKTQQYFDLKTFKEFNKKIDQLNYDNVRLDASTTKDFKTITQLCKIILQNGRELHTAFDESLNLVAGRIPAQSQQSFMTQRVIGFDSSDINTAMVSTFQLFLQGSDLDIDAVTLLGYEFDKNGKFVAWSPYFKSDSKANLQASKNMPLPTGLQKEIYAEVNASDNFFETYDRYFGTLFKTIPLADNSKGKNVKIKTKDGVPELRLDLDTPENIELFAEFLRTFNEVGINIKALYTNGKLRVRKKDFFDAPNIVLEDGKEIAREWNLFAKEGGLNFGREQVYQAAQQLLEFANIHNNYLNTAEEHLRDKMSKNYIVHYIYKVAESPCNQTEGQISVDTATQRVKWEAAHSAMATASDSYAPGGAEVKNKSVGEGQVGKACVGFGAVGIKANSTTQFYIAELLNYGSDEDKAKILFKTPVVIGGKTYKGFSNLYTDKQFSDQERLKFKEALDLMDNLDSPEQVTRDVAVEIASLLSIAVDNAKDLALAKINSGPRLMGMYAYGLTLGIPIEQLVKIMNSQEGRILTEMTEGSVFNNDTTAFKVLDVFDKLDGNIGSDLNKYIVIPRSADNKAIKSISKSIITTNDGKRKSLEYRNTTESLFAGMYEAYSKWFDTNKEAIIKTLKRKNPQQKTIKKANTLGGMLSQLLKMQAFTQVYHTAIKQGSELDGFITKVKNSNTEVSENWIAAFNQMVSYIKDIESKAALFNKFGGFGKDLRTLAEGAEEMRILGSILSINKGLKSSISDAESFIDTIENLIYDRKQILRNKLSKKEQASEKDKIDFHRFMVDEEYQQKVIETYENIKHSVNIPHLISKVPHFKGYLTTQLIPTAFFEVASVKYRTVHKYRKDIYNGQRAKPKSLFSLFGVDGKSEKEAILKGLENLIHFKMFTRWAYDKKITFKVPKGFKYFTKKGQELVSNDNQEVTINLFTEPGLATFKKYMEEIYIPMLKDDPNWATNEFVKNLIKISYNKTPLHDEVVTYSLHGDLMAKSGRQAEINAKMFADFQRLSKITFQDGTSIPSLADAFYLYAQYCYMGKKGQKSLMALFDSNDAVGSLAKSFNDHIAKMDDEGNLSCSEEELIIWCAPVGNQNLKSNWGYVSSSREFGISLKQRVKENTYLSEEQIEQLQDAQDAIEDEMEGSYRPKPEKFVTYDKAYIATSYDRLTRNHFLVPSTSKKVEFVEYMPMNLYGLDEVVALTIKSDMIKSIELPLALEKILQQKIDNGEITKFKSVEEFEKDLLNDFKQLHIPYKVSLFSDNVKEVDFGIFQTILEQKINC